MGFPSFCTTMNKQSFFIYALVREAEARHALVSDVFRYSNDKSNCWRNVYNKSPMSEICEINARWVNHPVSYIRLHQCAKFFATPLIDGYPTRIIDLITLAQILMHCLPHSRQWTTREDHLRARCDAFRLEGLWEHTVEMWQMGEEVEFNCPWGKVPVMTPTEATAAMRFRLPYWFYNITPSSYTAKCVVEAVRDRLDAVQKSRIQPGKRKGSVSLYVPSSAVN